MNPQSESGDLSASLAAKPHPVQIPPHIIAYLVGSRHPAVDSAVQDAS